MHLGIERTSALVFDGLGGPDWLVEPRPAISLCQLIAAEEDWKKVPTGGLHQNPRHWAFREDSFDPVTRIRRGRLYQPYGGVQPDPYLMPWDCAPKHIGAAIDSPAYKRVELYRYLACTALLAVPNQGRGAVLVLGSGAGTTAFTILQVESLVTGDIMVTLKAKTAYGVIPDLMASAVPEASLKPVQQALERAVNSVFRETPVSVVDQCRNAMATVLGHYLGAEEAAEKLKVRELGQLVGRLQGRKEDVCASAAHIIARLHSRGKSNEQLARGAREPVDEDAEFAVHALGLVMREIGWAV